MCQGWIHRIHPIFMVRKSDLKIMKEKQPEVANHYTKMQIDTASRQKQLTMLHEKCTWFILKAISEIGPERRSNLNRAQNILAQLQAALRVGDDVSEGLFYIYDYAYVLLERDDEKDCNKALSVMSVLRDTFKELLLRL